MKYRWVDQSIVICVDKGKVQTISWVCTSDRGSRYVQIDAGKQTNVCLGKR